MKQFILNLSCTDICGIVADVASLLAANNLNITESSQFSDPDSGQFFMRTAFENPQPITPAQFAKIFQPVAEKFSMNWQFYDAASAPRVLILVSKFDHCLTDLLYRVRVGSLKMQIVGVVSNHEIARPMVEDAKLPYYYWAGGRTAQAENEAKLADLIEKEKIDLIVLARYMQVLSDKMVARFESRIINIHHSFLPSFKGAAPYSQAHKRGVKMIGASAHFVTPELDEGPIITQQVADIRHDMSVDNLSDVGRDIEQRTLAKAVRLYIERRILLNGEKTIIFD